MMQQCAGLDGCRGGWFAVQLDSSGFVRADLLSLGCEERLRELCRQSELVLVDIPIGLRDRGREERLSDRMLRGQLGKRGSSVFPVPVREAVYAGSYAEACEENRKRTGKKISRQSWNIVPEIRAMDIFLTRYRECIFTLRESSPELCFARMAAMTATELQHGKNTQEGIRQRVAVLEEIVPGSHRFYASCLEAYPRRQVAQHDILDAMVLAASARLILRRGAVYYPEQKEYDARGLPMQALCFKTEQEVGDE
jgi:predicted RNase H-like nuclease